MKKDKLQFYVSVTQILSSLAVLISIIILITEYRRSGIVNEKSLENLVYSRMMEMDKILIENREIAEIVIKASPDGHTLLFHGSSLWMMPLLQKVPFDPAKHLRRRDAGGGTRE